MQEQHRTAERSGLVDPYLRLAVNLIGLPPLAPAASRVRKPQTTLGTSLTVAAPLGQYDASKLVNLGTHRWAFRAELGLSQPVGRWLIELDTAARLIAAQGALTRIGSNFTTLGLAWSLLWF